MPELDGIEGGTSKLAFNMEAPVIIIITSYSQQDLIDKARDSGVYGHLIKTSTGVVETVSSYLRDGFRSL